MKKNIFNFRLFIDAMKQLRIIGITATVILCIEAILIPIGIFLSQRTEIEINYSTYTFLDVHFLIVLSFIIIAPLLTLYLFNFLNSRNASDFYHSIPQTRTCLYFSYFGAIVAWLFIVIFTSSVLAIVAGFFMKSFYVINTVSIFLTIFDIFVGSIFVAACITIAMSITGTLFNNIIVSGIIIFVPRIITTVILSTIASTLPIISVDSMIPYLAAKYNVVTGSIISFLDTGTPNNTEALSSLSSGIYTLLLSLILMLIGMILFRVRKSESSGFSAPNRFLQAVYRIIIALIICLFPICMIFQDIVQKVDITTSTIFEYIIFYIIAIIIYFIYELITTKKWRNLIKSIPALFIVAILNFGIIVSMFGIYNHVVNYTPNAEEIDTIQLISPKTYSYNYQPLLYFTKSTEEIKLNNDKIKQIISDNLKLAVNSIKESNNNFFYSTDNSTVKTVAIHSGSKTYYRNITISEKDLMIIGQELAKNETFRNLYLNLPQVGKNDTTIHLQNVEFNKETQEAIYNTFRNELANMEFGEWYTILNSQYMLDKDSPLDYIIMTSSLGTNSYTAEIPITSDFKETCNLYLKEIQNNSKSKQDDFLNLFNQTSNMQFSVDFTILNTEDNTIYDTLYYYNKDDNNFKNIDKDELSKVLAIIGKSFNVTPSIESEIIRITGYSMNNTDYKNENYYFYISIENKEDLETVKNFLKSI